MTRMIRGGGVLLDIDCGGSSRSIFLPEPLTNNPFPLMVLFPYYDGFIVRTRDNSSPSASATARGDHSTQCHDILWVSRSCTANLIGPSRRSSIRIRNITTSSCFPVFVVYRYSLES